MVNVELLKEVKEAIRTNPDQLDMSEWRAPQPGRVTCGAVMCVAGWACALAGGRWLTANPKNRDAMFYLHPQPGDAEEDIQTVKLGKVDYRGIHAKVRAARLLGLTEDQADKLFLNYNNDEVEEAIDQLIEEAEALKAIADG